MPDIIDIVSDIMLDSNQRRLSYQSIGWKVLYFKDMGAVYVL